MRPPLDSRSEPTVWEQKLRDYRLKIETSQMRAWREEAEDPHTTGARLKQIAEAVRNRNKQAKNVNHGQLAKQALVRHPNTPPDLLLPLAKECAGAFCQNPIAPLLLLEMPDFAVRLGGAASFLLAEKNAPLALVNALRHSPALDTLGTTVSDPLTQRNLTVGAGLHILVAGEVPTRENGERSITAFWRDEMAYLAALFSEPYAHEDPSVTRHRHEQFHGFMQTNGDLLELGFAPAWIKEPPFDVEPRIPKLSHEAEKWLAGRLAPNSPEERDVWARIAPELAARPELAAFIRPDADEEVLATLAGMSESRMGQVREVIAAHPNATPVVFERLARILVQEHRNGRVYPYLVLRLVVTHPNASTEFLAQMVQFPDAEVRRLARRHPNAPANALVLSQRAVYHGWSNLHSIFSSLQVFVGGLKGALSLNTLLRRCVCGDAGIRLTVALALPSEPLPFPTDTDTEKAALARSPEAEAACAGCTTRDLLEHLARDGNRLVRWAAQTRLHDPDYRFTWR